MNSLIRLVTVVAALVLMPHITPSWGQPVCASPGCNPTDGDANFNTAGGAASLGDVVSGSAGGFSNTAFGDEALLFTTTGSNNTGIGRDALMYNRTGNNNTAIGTFSLFANVGGYNNTASGFQALSSNTEGSHNAGHGFQALYHNTTGCQQHG